MKLSKRLTSLANLVSSSDIVADIGCDHALLDIYLIKNNILPKILVTDINLLLVDEILDWKEVQVKTRYSSKVANAKIIQEIDKIKVVFEEPQRAITPGQSAVFYVEDIVLGGGKIEC